MPKTRQPTYAEVLTAAVQDMADNGYDSPERVNFWLDKLRQAAELSLKAPKVMEDILRDAMLAVYNRLVERGQIIDKYHFGVSRFTLEHVKPQLRAELDRRILASASLIKNNRQEAVANTLKRFEGWATSIPKGGTEGQKKAKVKKDIKKAMGNVRFAERRVVIDQSHKLVSNLNDILATDGGALAGRWRSNWRQPGYDYREDHKDRDGRVYTIRDNWALTQGLMKVGPDGYYDQITAAGEEVYCRCYIVYVYSLSGLPKDQLTAKGQMALREARARLSNAA